HGQRAAVAGPLAARCHFQRLIAAGSRNCHCLLVSVLLVRLVRLDVRLWTAARCAAKEKKTNHPRSYMAIPGRNRPSRYRNPVGNPFLCETLGSVTRQITQS